MTTQTFRVHGMTCDHCVSAVTEELNAVEGVSAVTIALVPPGTSTVTVEADHEVSDVEVSAALDEAGDYTLA